MNNETAVNIFPPQRENWAEEKCRKHSLGCRPENVMRHILCVWVKLMRHLFPYPAAVPPSSNLLSTYINSFHNFPAQLRAVDLSLRAIICDVFLRNVQTEVIRSWSNLWNRLWQAKCFSDNSTHSDKSSGLALPCCCAQERTTWCGNLIWLDMFPPVSTALPEEKQLGKMHACILNLSLFLLLWLILVVVIGLCVEHRWLWSSSRSHLQRDSKGAYSPAGQDNSLVLSLSCSSCLCSLSCQSLSPADVSSNRLVCGEHYSHHGACLKVSGYEIIGWVRGDLGASLPWTWEF